MIIRVESTWVIVDGKRVCKVFDTVLRGRAFKGGHIVSDSGDTCVVEIDAPQAVIDDVRSHVPEFVELGGPNA